MSPGPVRLYGCQTFDLGVPMGWVNRKGYRRFRRKYKSVARQNGKTFENGITAAYLAGFGGYRFENSSPWPRKHGRPGWPGKRWSGSFWPTEI